MQDLRCMTPTSTRESHNTAVRVFETNMSEMIALSFKPALPCKSLQTSGSIDEKANKQKQGEKYLEKNI